MFSRVAALTVEGPQALGKNLDNFRTHKSGPVERVSGSYASTFSRAEVFRAQCKIRELRHTRRTYKNTEKIGTKTNHTPKPLKRQERNNETECLVQVPIWQSVQERRNFREGISGRSGHGSSRYADLWHREVWVTVQKLCTVLNSKTASCTTFACTCLAGFFFCSLSNGPM